MFLKNYTSEAPVSRTIYRIEQTLIKCGVSGIMKEYSDDKGTIAAITFQIKLPDAAPWTIRLPANVQKAWDALWLNYVDGDRLTSDGMRVSSSYKKKHKSEFRDQAARTAWKIIQDWVEVQMSMIQMQQADFREVFLPYAWDGEKTYFERLRHGGFRAMLPERSSDAHSN